ncbi:MAG: nitrate- and nitrite sensing domain-containing protein [Rhodospirillaceae bacterium]|nr:nitrate- and nitrite sensing domain-containing protein [Rhodospirillales bacterium]
MSQPPSSLLSNLLRRARKLARYRLAAAVVAPMLTLVAFSGYVVHEKLESYRDSADLLLAAQVARTSHALARELEDERALVALYLGTNRESWRNELDDQRALTDVRAAELRSQMILPKVAFLFDRARSNFDLGTLEGLRSEVDGDALLHDSLDGYNGLISNVIASSARLGGHDLSNLIAAYMDLGHIKDRIARGRSIGSTWLLQGRRDSELMRMFMEAHAEQEAFLASFRGHASAHQWELFEQIVGTSLLDEVDRLHDLAISSRLNAADSAGWHHAHTAVTQKITRAEEVLAAEMEAQIHSNLRSAQITFYLVVAVVVGLVVFSLETLRRSERRATRAEVQSRKLFRAVEQSPVSVMITDVAGQIEYVNPAFSRMTGFERDEVLGANPRLLRSPLTPQDIYDNMWRIIGAGHEWRGEIVNQRRDGTVYWEQMTIAPVKGADGRVCNYIAVKEDVTEVRSLRQALDREHANIRRVLEAIHDGIALTDDQGIFQYANPALVAEFGAVDGKVASDIFDTPELPPTESATRSEWRSEQTGRTYDLTSTWVHNPDTSLSLLQVFHDITTRKQAEEALNSAREAAELANRAKSEFLATMSHELRTPLNAIIGFSEIIEQQLLGPVGQPQYTDYARDINDSGKHLLQLINDILDVARLEVGRVALREDRVDPALVVRACLSMVRERAETGEVTLFAEPVTADLPLLWADERRLKQIVVNVLGNAVKFTPAGGTVTVAVQADATGLSFIVTDTGIGIAPADLLKVMAPFGQADSGMARRYQGSGLGLPLSRKLMELHNGELSLDSTLGEGTMVTLRFPAERLRQA